MAVQAFHAALSAKYCLLRMQVLVRMTTRCIMVPLAGGTEAASCYAAGAGFPTDVQEGRAAPSRAGRGTFYAATVLVEVLLPPTSSHM